MRATFAFYQVKAWITENKRRDIGFNAGSNLTNNHRVTGKWTYILIPEVSYNVFVCPGVTHKLPLEESYIKDGGVEVDELEDEHFKGKIIIEIRLCSVHF